MNLSNISLPEVYMINSADFRFFRRWFEYCLTGVHHDIENLSDIYDPLRCRAELIWLLADTMGFKFDDRLPVSFNRLVLMYFMSMIRNRGSKDGVTLAAEVNLAQFNLLNYGKEKDILYNRLEDTSIPVNAVYVTPHTAEGYIDVVYFSDKVPIDACIEYVRPVGMYLFQQPGVRYDARTKISIDARLTTLSDEEESSSLVSTRVGHYSREDYARLQKMKNQDSEHHELDTSHTRRKSWNRNSVAEGTPEVNSGYRALYTLQLCNNEHIVKSLIDPIFGIGYTPTDVSTYDGPSVLPEYADFPKAWNLRYDRAQEESLGEDVYTLEDSRTTGYTNARPRVNPIMGQVGDALALDAQNITYTKVDSQGNISVVTEPDE